MAGAYSGVTVDWHPFWRMVTQAGLIGLTAGLILGFVTVIACYVRYLRRMKP